jgi:hypothetical protein
VAFVALVAADTFLAATGRDRQRRLTKPLLMPTLMIGRDRATQRALALGWAGDMALPGTSDAAFMAGLASFLASHLAWIAVLGQRHTGGRLRARPALAAAPHRGVRRIERLPVEADGQGPHSGHPKAAAGGALFLMSDTFLALEKYAAVPLPGHQGLVMATYASAQALLAELSMLPIILTEHRRVIPSACQASVTIARYGVRLPGLLPRGWCSTVVSEEGKNTLWWPSRQRTR